MKILILHRDIGTGSVGKIVEDLYFGIKNAGHQCKVAYGGLTNRSKIPSNDLYSVNDKIGMSFHALLSRITDRAGFYSRRKTKQLIKFIDSFKPDVIHIHGCYGYWLDIDTLYKYFAKSGVRIINTLHSCWDFTGHCCYFTHANCKKWEKCCHDCPEKKSYPKSFVFDRSRKNFLQKKELFLQVTNMEYVSPSFWMSKCFSRSFLNKFKMTVIKNGIDLESFKKTHIDLSKYGVNAEKTIILGVASVWDERKGLKDFVDLSRVIDEKYQIVLVGLNDKQIKRMPANVVCIKRTNSKEELAGLYSSACVLFNPTGEDNYPTVNLESIACGTPVVTYDSGGSPEAVIEYGFGRVIKPHDYKALLEYVDYVNGNVVLPIKPIKNLSKQFMIDKYLYLYTNDLKAA